MRYVVGFLLALGLVAVPLGASAQEREEAATKAAVLIHAKSHMPPQLMLRTRYFCDVGAYPLLGPPSASGPAPLIGSALALASVTSPLSMGAQPVEADSLSFWQSQEPATITEEGQPAKPLEGQSKGMSRGGKIAVGVVVPLLVVGISAGAAVMATGFDDIW